MLQLRIVLIVFRKLGVVHAPDERLIVVLTGIVRLASELRQPGLVVALSGEGGVSGPRQQLVV